MALTRVYFRGALISVLLTSWFAGMGQSVGTTAIPDRKLPVYRSALDQRARVVSVQLHPTLWVAYDADRCALYRAWQAGIAWSGAVYTGQNGPQPTSKGAPYLEGTLAMVWMVGNKKGEWAVKPVFKGYLLMDSSITLLYDLVLPTGKNIRVEETPFYTEQNNKKGLSRTFKISGAPAGTVVLLRMELKSLESIDDLQVKGRFDIAHTSETNYDWGKTLNLTGRLVLMPDSLTNISTFFHPKSAGAQ